MNPHVSVIIPTANRPQYLPRAVESALAKMVPDEVEVIVVPNGPDDSWRKSLLPYFSNPALKVIPISIADANVARNAGLKCSRGFFVRFLDDDDYLIPENSRKQIEFAYSSGADFCSGFLHSIDDKGNLLGILPFPENHDFVCASLSISGFTLPTGNLIRRSCIGETRWEEGIPRMQDYAWMMKLALSREWKWEHYYAPVGYWYQHPNQRISTMRTYTERQNKVIDIILNLYKFLEEQDRLNDCRRYAISVALWHLIHHSFPHQPLYFSDVAMKAINIHGGSRPEHPIFKSILLRKLHPLFSEWAMLPFRIFVRKLKDLKGNCFGWDYRRRL